MLFKEDGTGLLISNYNQNHKNIAITNDFGANYAYFSDNSFKYDIEQTNGIGIKDKFIYFFKRNYKNDNSNYSYSETDIFSIDSDFIYHKAILDSCQISFIVKVYDDLYALGRKRGMGKPSDFYFDRWVLYKSFNHGFQWDTAAINISIDVKGILQEPKVYNNLIIIPFHSSLTDENYLYTIDINSNNVDSIVFKNKLDSKKKPFIMNNFIYLFDDDNNLHYGNSLEGDWDSLHINNFLPEWENYNHKSIKSNQDHIFYTWSDNSSTSFIVTGRSTGKAGIFGDPIFKMNLVKLTLNKPTIVENESIEYKRTWLYATNPFPQPAKNIVRSRVYWNSAFNIEDASIKVYDIFGMQVPQAQIDIEKEQAYSALLTWDCSLMPSGIYFIHIIMNGETKSIPVVVSDKKIKACHPEQAFF